MDTMKASEAVFATATDGDADRLGLVLPGGAFFNSHQIYAVLLSVLYEKGLRGRVVKASTDLKARGNVWLNSGGSQSSRRLWASSTSWTRC